MKNRKRDIIYLFICTLPVSGMMIYWLIWEQEYSLLPWALLPQGFIILWIAIMLLQERFLRNNARRIETRPVADLRQEALESFENKSFREITADSMSADLKALYRHRFAPKNLLLGTVCICCAVLFAAYIVTGIGNGVMPFFYNIVAGIAVLFFGLAGFVIVCEAALQFAGIHVSSFEKKHREELAMIKRSYMGGRMIVAADSAINIGIDYIISVRSSECECIRISDVIGAESLRVRKVKRDRAGFMTKLQYEYVISIYVKKHRKPVKYIVTELQSEYIRDELIRRGIK